MTNDLEKQFDNAMMNIYKRAKSEASYNATRFLHMLMEHRGLETAQILLHNPTVSEGYKALWERGRLDLTVESLVLEPKWKDLFTEDELHLAKERLEKYKQKS